MDRIVRSVAAGLFALGISFGIGLTGPAGTAAQGLSLKLDQIAALPKSKPQRSVRVQPVAAGKDRFVLTPSSRNLIAYDFTLWAANYCYSEGPVRVLSEIPSGSGRGGRLELQAEIAYEAGMCAQSIKELSYKGEVSTSLSGPVDVIIHVRDQRSGRVSKHKTRMVI